MAHRFHFFRAGGVDQVSLRDGDDLVALVDLDQKLWLALAMPTTDVDIDPVTLELLDADHDKRVRVPDVKAAITWVKTAFKNPGDVLKSSDQVSLSAIGDDSIAAAARQMLVDLGKSDATAVSIDDTVAIIEAFKSTKLNGDGVVYPGSTDDENLAKLITDIVATQGGVPDRSGHDGTNVDLSKAFFAEVDLLAAWSSKVTSEADTVNPLGDGTAAAVDALLAVGDKLDDYFARCQMAAYDSRSAASMIGQDADYLALGAKVLTSGADDIARLPLAQISALGRLNLNAGINPAWASKVATFVAAAVIPLLGTRAELTVDDLGKIREKLGAHLAWRGEKPTTKLGALDAGWLAELARPELRSKLDRLIAADVALEGSYAELAAVSKLVRFQRDLGRILRNFVNFSDFYRKQDGVFQAGTLFVDGRAAALCVPVSDAGKHALLAGSSGAYLAYCDITRDGVTKSVAATISNGDADNLFVGRNGIFYDRSGKDWDATITKIIGNPISVREAFFAPYKKLIAAIEGMATKRAAAADAASTAKMESTGVAVASVAPPEPGAPKPVVPGPPKLDVGTIAVIGMAIGGIGTVLAAVLGGFIGLGKWLPLGVIALLLMISGPSMILAWLKLRKRNLGPILDSNGWAINGRARVNVAFGREMTKLAVLPKGSTRSLEDPFADKRVPWKRWVFLAILLTAAVLWFFGKLDGILPKSVSSVEVLGSRAPAYVAPAAEVPPTP